MRVQREHAITALVAVGVIIAALQEGGFAPGVFPAYGLLIWWALLICTGFGLLPLSPVSRIGLAAAGCFAAFAIIQALSIDWASDAGRAFEGTIRTTTYVGLFVLVLFAARRGEVRPWLAGIAIGIIGVAITALATRIVPDLAGDEALVELVPSAAGRLSFPIGYWNGLAALMAIGLVLTTWFGANARGEITRASAIAAFPLPALVIYFASSRGGFAAALFGLVALLILGPNRARITVAMMLGVTGAVGLIAYASGKSALLEGLQTSAASEQGVALLFALLAAVAVLAIIGLLIDGPVQRLSPPRWLRAPVLAGVAAALMIGVFLADPSKRFEEFKASPASSEQGADFIKSHLTSGSGSGRWQFWSAAWDAFEAEPAVGIGTGGYETWWNQEGPFFYSLQNAHSLPLETLAEVGVAGGIFLFAFFALAFAAGYLGREGSPAVALAAAVVVSGLASSVIDWTWQLPAVFAPVIIATALLCRQPAGRDVAEDREAETPPAIPLRVAVGGLAAVAVASSALLLFASSKLESSRERAREGDYLAALEDARDAIAIEPWAAEPRLQAGLTLERLGDLEAASRDVREAAERAPEDWRPQIALSRLELQRGRLDAALAALRRAKALNPNSPLLLSP